MAYPQRVLIIEDELLVALDIEETVQLLGYTVVGSAGNPWEAKDLYFQHLPSIVICDVNLHAEQDGIDLMKELYKIQSCQVVFLTAYHDEKTINRSLELPNSQYLVKPFNANQLKATLQLATAKTGPSANSPDFLSSRELEIIRQLADGKTMHEIADVLNLSYHTVTTHTKNIRRKMEVHSNLDVVAVAFKNKWI
ncbi:response regulator transcription factor [Cecembia calidifontis]|uniref:DNA-binding NarL/FixJ family response regulator n=1 Tax=Cecembia calidifontis TaxID=1187080 RepID=A0A4Q7P4B7_9BACT|nr:DNA-binding response regulator [Cecembia calidifontis]RZS94811.1 DNA-binding NarL/FixJ family response regulator [Cecembia calidifontis]